MVQLALAYSTVYQLGLDQVCTHSQGKIFFHTAQSVSACVLPDHCTLIFPDVTVPLSWGILVKLVICVVPGH